MTHSSSTLLSVQGCPRVQGQRQGVLRPARRGHPRGHLSLGRRECWDTLGPTGSHVNLPAGTYHLP
eukprot:976433-Pelagomonas_calceolata.AAC.2